MLQFSGSIIRNEEGYTWITIYEKERQRHLSRGSRGVYRLTYGSRIPTQEDFANGRFVCLWPLGESDTPPTTGYDLFTEEPALFRIFADLDPTPEAILQFANEYGAINPIPQSPGLSPDASASLHNWRAAIQSIREYMADAEKIQSIRNQSRRAEAAAGFVSTLLTGVSFDVSAVNKQNAISVSVSTRSLFDAMKLQLIEALIKGKQYRACEQCGKPFELTPQVNRSDRVYCSDNCRVKAYHRRRKQAVELRGKRYTLRDIAKATGSDMDTIKQWLQPKGK